MRYPYRKAIKGVVLQKYLERKEVGPLVSVVGLI